MSFYRQLAMIISADVSIVQSVKLIADQTQKPKFQKILHDIHSNVNEGMKFKVSQAV